MPRRRRRDDGPYPSQLILYSFGRQRPRDLICLYYLSWMMMVGGLVVIYRSMMARARIIIIIIIIIIFFISSSSIQRAV